jgi:hypothetical protein
MSARRADLIAADLRASGTTVEVVSLGLLDDPGALVGLQQYRYLRGLRR